MNDATIATYDGHHSKARLDRTVGRRCRRSGRHAAAHAYPLHSAANPLYLEVYADRQVREDRGSYIADLLSAEYHADNPQAYSAASDHAKHLLNAQRFVGEALNLVGLLLAALGDEGDSRAMQIEAGLKAVEKKLSKAYNTIDKHDARHTNLFLAYFNLKEKTEGSEEN